MSAILLLFLVGVDLDALVQNPGVAKVERVLPGDKLIVHILDYHIVKKDALGLNLGIEGAELDREYSKVISDATAVHKSKLLICAFAAASMER